MERTSRNASIPHRLIEVIDGLNHLIAGTEEQFLAIGENLQDFKDLATGIFQTSESTSVLLVGPEVGEELNRLEAVLDQIDQFLANSEAEVRSAHENLRQIQTTIDEIYAPIASLQGVLKSLRMLGISIRIESSGIASSRGDFYNIANQIDELSRLIKQKSIDILGKERALTASIKETLVDAVAEELRQSQEARLRLDASRSRLNDLDSSHRECSDAISIVSGTSREISRKVGDVVESIQYHDIARQQIDRSKQALYSLCEGLTLQSTDGECRAFSDCQDHELIGDVRNVCRNQSIELRYAGDKLITATYAITAGLNGIVDDVVDIAANTKQMAGAAATTGHTFFRNMELGLTAVTDSLSQNAAADRDLSDVMGPMTDAIGEMSGFVEDIETIVSEIEMIALNAQIKAAGIGSQGAPLGVIAESIKQLSISVTDQITPIPSTLKQLVSTAQQLRADFTGESVNEKSAAAAAALERMNSELDGVKRLNSMLVDNLTELDQQVSSLAEAINRAVDKITVDEDTATVVTKTVLSLDAIAQQAEQVVGCSDSAAPVDSPMAAELSIPAGLADELGENIEMFEPINLLGTEGG